MHDPELTKRHTPRVHRISLSRRFQLAVTLLVGFVLLSTTRTLIQSVRDAPQDDVSSFAQQMQAVRSALPPHGTIGYISNIPDSRAFFKAYFLTQYELAPLVVTNIGGAPTNTTFGSLSPPPLAPSSSLVIGVFVDDVPRALLEQYHLFVVQRFAGNIVLLRKEL